MDILKMMKTFLALGELTNEYSSIEEKIKYKEKIVFATMRQLIPEWRTPDDWYDLSNKEKLKRLENLEKATKRL